MPSAQIAEVTVVIPIGASDATSGVRIDVDLGSGKGNALNRLREGLQARVARLDNGRLVVSNADVVRWLSEEIGRAITANGVAP